MALSNWASVAFDKDGSFTEDPYSQEDGFSVEIYKNWLYLHSPKMWYEGNGYVANTFAQLSEGDLTICGVNILAIRGPQNAVFTVISNYKELLYCGIGCYGYKDSIDVWKDMNFDPAMLPYLEKIQACMTVRSGGIDYEWGVFKVEDVIGMPDEFLLQAKPFGRPHATHVEIPLCPSLDLDELWCGVRQETYDEFKIWLRTVNPYSKTLPAYVQALPETPVYYNKGDQFFAENLGFETPLNNPTPLLHGLIDGIQN